MSKAVLVTGASTGIGFDCVRVLIENGFDVVATVRKESDKAHLEIVFPNQIRVLILDVNNFEQVSLLPKTLLESFNIRKLHGLVNNAGVAFGGPFAFQDFSEVETLIQTNVLALMKMTQVCVPLLQADTANLHPGGRIVNISSISGTSALPFLAVYAASKHAVEGFSAALHNELKLLKIKVLVVAPGSIKTPIWQKGFEVVQNKYKNTVYSEAVERFMKKVESEIEHALPVAAVSSCVLDALKSENPKLRYEPIPRKFRNKYVMGLLPRFFLDYSITQMLGLAPRD
jgi:short-subunit dehydrogenase